MVVVYKSNMLTPTGIITQVRVNEFFPRECFVCCIDSSEFVWNEGVGVPATCYMRLISRCVIFSLSYCGSYYLFKIDPLFLFFSRTISRKYCLLCYVTMSDTKNKTEKWESSLTRVTLVILAPTFMSNIFILHNECRNI